LDPLKPDSIGFLKMVIKPNPNRFGAQVLQIDLSQDLSQEEFLQIEKALGTYSVLCFASQNLSSLELKTFASRFGTLEVNVANQYQDPDHPQVMILSNKLDEQGKPLGLKDAGQDWHTDMSYSKDIAFANVLYALEIPFRDGLPLGNTAFCSTRLAYQALPVELKNKLKGMTVTHDFAKFWDNMRTRPGSSRAPLSAQQRAAKPPVSHPIFLKHPITADEILYANPGYAIRINELKEDESERVLKQLFDIQLMPQFHYQHRWRVGDVLMWDNISTLHNAVADYRADEHRYIKRCQVMADRYLPEGTSKQAVS
jgi:taurine dioxygenase